MRVSIERMVESRWWPAIATSVVYLWSLLFWWLFIFVYAMKYLDLPLGLGGAIYPVLFSLPVIVITVAYELILRPYMRTVSTSGAVAAWCLVVPAITLPVLLVVFSPTDSEFSLPQLLWQAIAK